jgi:hypothetical protein
MRVWERRRRGRDREWRERRRRGRAARGVGAAARDGKSDEKRGPLDLSE